MMDHFSTFLSANQHALWVRTGEHLELMFVSVLAATIVGLPAGVLAARVRALSTPLLTLANIVQTVPSIALLGFLLPVLGIGQGTASVALFLYALLPIMRNTITGLQGVEPAVVDAARGMGMNERQILFRVEFPLAIPVIFAGIRTAAVINVGVTTLSALIGAGGLGTFIFRGLATNNTAIIMLGAVPAALLALTADGLLALGERGLRHRRRMVGVLLVAVVLGGFAALGWQAWDKWSRPVAPKFGFTSEFMERPDGYAAWRACYALPALDSRELDPGLLYDALKLGEVDVACGFSTDGRIAAFNLRMLRDDRHFFPVYDAALLARAETLNRFPALRPLLARLRGALDEGRMRQLNLEVDEDKKSPAAVAAEFLADWATDAGVNWDATRAREKMRQRGVVDMTIGTKNFTEQYVLGQIVAQLVNGATSLHAGIRAGLGGTSICFQALQRGDIDVYPEYSGTLLASVLKPSQAKMHTLMRRPTAATAYLKEELAARYDFVWLASLGFNNTYALLVRSDDPTYAAIHTISDLRTLFAR